MKRAVWALPVLLYALHNDLWLWNEPTRWFGLPAGLAYHVLFCLAVVASMAALVRFAWPPELDSEEQDDEEARS